MRTIALLILACLLTSCQSAHSIAAAGSTASARLETDLTNARTHIAATPAALKPADDDLADALAQLPIINRAIALVDTLATQVAYWEDSWFGGKAHRAFWTVIIAAIALVLGGIVLVGLTGGAGLTIAGRVGTAFRALEKFLSGVFPLSAWISHWYSSIHTKRLVSAVSTTTTATLTTPTPVVATETTTSTMPVAPVEVVRAGPSTATTLNI